MSDIKKLSRVLVLGDSHTSVFGGVIAESSNNKIEFDVRQVVGATALGAVNPNFKTHALETFRTALTKINVSNYQKIGIMLGEVDCGFVIWYYSEKYGISIKEQLERSLSNYDDFLNNEILPLWRNNAVILFGAVLPTIKDNTDKRFITGARSEVSASLKQRIKLTFEYNEKLQDLAAKYSLTYIDITREIFDNEKGEVKEMYLNDDPFDHHLSKQKSLPLWLNHIFQTL